MDYITINEAPIAIKNQRNFVVGQNFSGTAMNPDQRPDLGRLPSAWVIRLNQDRARYAVYSYGTPIAWLTENGTAVIPDVKYSATTGKHQGIAAKALKGNSKIRTSL